MFALQVLKAFQANQGLLLAGAVAYYALLSIVPLLILMIIALSHVIDQAVLLATLRGALEYVVPGEGKAVVLELKAFLDHRELVGWVLLVTMLFFSVLGFRVLESAISVIFLHRVVVRRRHFVVEILLISAIYYFMPVGRLSVQHALIGGTSAAVLWEIIRHALAWYFGTLSQVSVVYGSLATAIIVLLSLEVADTLLLLGAQVIAEYERIEIGAAPPEPVPMRIQ